MLRDFFVFLKVLGLRSTVDFFFSKFQGSGNGAAELSEERVFKQ